MQYIFEEAAPRLKRYQGSDRSDPDHLLSMCLSFVSGCYQGDEADVLKSFEEYGRLRRCYDSTDYHIVTNNSFFSLWRELCVINVADRDRPARNRSRRPFPP